MTDTPDLETIRQELHELRLLYKKIADQHIPTEEPTPEDIEALESEDETVGEEEILRALKRPSKDSLLSQARTPYIDILILIHQN